MKIVINAGHAPNGKPDPGAVNPKTGTRESDITCAVAKKVVNLLKKKGHLSKFVQDDSLWRVCNFANTEDADIFVSIHCNAFANASANGTETFHYPTSTRGKQLAKHIQTAIVNDLDTRDRGVKSNTFYVLKHTNAPAVLVELAFITNATDEKLLKTKQDAFANSIVKGIEKYIKGV